MQPKIVRSRACYLFAALATLIAGLVSRSLGLDKNHFIVSHVGDILWAALIYYIVRLVRPKLHSAVSALIAAVFCFGIELQQLYQAEWIVHLRSHKIPALILGHSFSSADLLCYASGISIALLLDTICSRKSTLAY